MFIRSAIAILFTLFFVACSSNPTRYNNVDSGNWQARALIKDNEESRSFIVNLDFNAKRDEVLRMDVTTTLGTGVASLQVTPKEVRYLIFDSKKFYFGQPSPGVMRPILSLPFDPRGLQSILFDLPITQPGWTCQTGDKGAVKRCEDPKNGVTVTWGVGNRERKTVLIEHAKASVQINFMSFKPKVEDRKNLFNLDAPESFQKLRVHARSQSESRKSSSPL